MGVDFTAPCRKVVVMDEITAAAYWKPAKRNKFVADLSEGWVIQSPETGKSLSSRRYATEEEAVADAPRVLAAYLELIATNTARAAETDRQAETTSQRPYVEVRSSVYGPGRVYRDNPGATQYDDGSGRYSVQIWDNS